MKPLENKDIVEVLAEANFQAKRELELLRKRMRELQTIRTEIHFMALQVHKGNVTEQSLRYAEQLRNKLTK